MNVLLMLLLASQFQFARLQYSTTEGLPMHAHAVHVKNWFTDYDDGSGRNMDGLLAAAIRRFTKIQVLEPVVVKPIDRKLFSLPFLYTVEPEQMTFSAVERRRMAQYLRRGGFWMLDDFHGCEERDYVIRSISEILGSEPDFETLDTTHPLFHTFFDIPEIVQVPVLDIGQAYSYDPSTRLSEAEPPCAAPQVLLARTAGVGNRQSHSGTILLTWNVDLGDGIEWADTASYPIQFSNYALKFFVNAIVYALSH